MQHAFYSDQQAALSFAIQQASRINTTVYERKYPSIRYRGLVPVDTTGPEFIKSVTYFSLEGAGAAEWQSAQADDVPRAEVLRASTESKVHTAAIGYGYNVEELAQAQMLGIALTDAKANAARRASEEMIDRVTMFGDAERGLNGVTNAPNVTVTTAAATGAGSSTFWQDKQPGQILEDVNAALSGVFTGTNTVELADTLLIPHAAHHIIGSRQYSEASDRTILQWIQTNNVYTIETGQPLTVRGLRGLEAAGAGGVGRLVAYRNDMDVLRLNMPMPFRFFPVYHAGPFRYDIPGMFRLGGVDVHLPGAMRYMDGV